MPTPFMHLQYAEEIRALAVARKGENGRLPLLLAQNWPAFYLGSVAADCQEVAGLSRVATHFYDVPPEPGHMAYPQMLAAYPQLTAASCLTPGQAVFIAAYSVHLMFDLLWFREVMLPHFVQRPDWAAPFEQRHLVHNVVLTYLDQVAYQSLPATAVTTLAVAEPDHWLPFVPDAALTRWRDRLVTQLQPGGDLETIAVYAGRMHISPTEFAANLSSSDWMTDHVFRFVPVADIQAQLHAAVESSLDIIEEYLGNCEW
jgi:hypothetical protein